MSSLVTNLSFFLLVTLKKVMGFNFRRIRVFLMASTACSTASSGSSRIFASSFSVDPDAYEGTSESARTSFFPAFFFTYR